MREVKLYYRDGDVGDGHPWEADCDIYNSSGATPAEALDNLAAGIKAATSDEDETTTAAPPVAVPVSPPPAPVAPAASPTSGGNAETTVTDTTSTVPDTGVSS